MEGGAARTRVNNDVVIAGGSVMKAVTRILAPRAGTPGELVAETTQLIRRRRPDKVSGHSGGAHAPAAGSDGCGAELT